MTSVHAQPPEPLELPARLTAPPRLTQRHPWLLPAAMAVHRARRRTRWARDSWSGRVAWATHRTADDLPVRLVQHGSLLLRELDPDQMHLQHNKVTNLRLAARRLDGIVIGPGESLSFNRVVGNCTRRKGYVDGMRLSNGSAEAGVGGGICQLANLVHWMVLHSPLTVVERSEHSFDPFPDRGRVLPWGVGCSIVYNYVDLVVRNDTDHPFQLRAWVGDRYLHGQLRTDERPPHSYRVEAREERFLRSEGRVFRRNEVWRRVIDRRTGEQVGDELVKSNCALVVYEPGPDVEVIDLD
ncbi:vancomycin resistance protein VanW [Nocardioides cavernae]|uniref:Vancomycin resistance protein VanW n=1 Tax=Nocardioides cavernae TaxID=1921566 RepID=A0A7Y9GYZ4_9ACTN|nr:VanW family protein [Nocardioides cavernae]NYE34925.1 vancomycin resistance protein VanW [Nocardioides cavernae]